MKTLSLTLEILTPIILTQREGGQKIKGLDWEVNEQTKTLHWKSDVRKKDSTLDGDLTVADMAKIGIIYTAYHNGTNYYIPGTTLKGNIMKLIKQTTLETNIFVKDCEVEGKDITIGQLGKIISIKKVKEQIANLIGNSNAAKVEQQEIRQIQEKDVFFPMVAHEMIFNPRKPIKLVVEVICTDEKTAEILLEKLNNLREIDIELEKNELDKILENAEEQQKDYTSQESIIKVKKIVNNLVEKVEKVKDKNILFLGGYRGFYRAFDEENSSAIYYVKTKSGAYYPIGLCTIEMKEVKTDV